MALLDPKGPIGDTERFVIVFAFVLMLIVVIPVLSWPFGFRENTGTVKIRLPAQMEFFRKNRTGHLAGPCSHCDMPGHSDLEYHLPFGSL